LTEPVAPESAPEPESAAPPETLAARYDLMQRAGGLIVPVITALMAFAIGGIILGLSGYNPFTTYWEIT
jgi:simple sugar transport system permease protein